MPLLVWSARNERRQSMSEKRERRPAGEIQRPQDPKLVQSMIELGLVTPAQVDRVVGVREKVWNSRRDELCDSFFPLKCDFCDKTIAKTFKHIYGIDGIARLVQKIMGEKIYCGPRSICTTERERVVAKLKTTKLYCQCLPCQERGQSKFTQLDMSKMNYESLILRFTQYGVTLPRFKEGHGIHNYARCKACGSIFVEPHNPAAASHFKALGFCSKSCHRTEFPVLTKPQKQQLEKVENILSGKIYRVYDLGSDGVMRANPTYPKWCSVCHETQWVTPSQIFKKKTELCYKCHGLSRRRLCVCGKPKRQNQKGPGFESYCGPCGNRAKDRKSRRKKRINRAETFLKEVQSLCLK